MAEKFDLPKMVSEGKDRTSIVAWALLVATAKADPSFKELTPESCRELTVEFRLNGIECNFSDLLERLQGEVDRRIVDAAKELVAERARGLFEKLDDLEREIGQSVEKLFLDH